ncbi:TonB-dependent receptor domain-containing protein [Pontibacter sp. HSC-36F09]|uniref:TonB-dependent receptor domain-containing protein n=1 Tax=Pontibacter sp. HSC-36F09 TaxID=2910966 RepID=UPI00209D1FB0|nr:TonB-dependent receptor [Pontibacter sp. HSC-36F09]MCP2045911.1 outer membrane receptor protein involved in Fe transport [Pontibacter sp. HSC-36F09]
MKKSVLFLMGLLCLFLSVSSAAWAQEAGKISGTLSDSLTGKPIEYATVALLQSGNTQALQSALTDANGRFSFEGIAPGNYQLAISFLGYQKKFISRVAVNAAKPETAVGNIRLVPSTTQLKEVTVEALRPTITQEADRMVVSIEGTALAAGRTAYDVLATLPGVFIDQEGNIQLNGRAGVTIMLDGKLTYLSARDLRSLLEGMSAENIRNIEIISNPSSKYDAEGSSGILNINLKKNTLQGINGSAYAGANYNGKQYGFSTGGNINHRTGPWNSFLNLDMARRVGGRDATFNRVFQGDESTTHFDQVATGNYEVQGPPAVRVGTDYSFDDRHSVGVMGYFNTNKLHADFLTETYIGNAPNQPTQFIDADNFNQNRFTNFTTNLHYMGKYDTIGTTLTADLDFVKIKNRGDANFFNYFYDLETGLPPTQDFLYTNTPNEFDIFAAKVDFTRPLANGRKLELGAKASRVVSDNDSRFYFNNSEKLQLDERRTNHFVYDENIYAGYLNLNSKLGEQLSVQAGLRAEYTTSRGESITTRDVNDRDYLNLFPSLFVQQEVSDNYQINYNYSRRIQRPNYGQLNPFFAYRDPYTYWQGNPDLRPQYTHAMGITQVFKKTYNLVLNYQLNRDVIAELPEIIPETSTTIYYVGNVPKSRNLSLIAIVPFTIMKNWESSNTMLLSYNEFSAVVNKQQMINDQVFYMLQTNHTIMLPKKIKMEVNGVYQGPAAYALYVVDPRWWVNVGVKKSFLDETLELSVNANDIFKTQDLIISALVGEGNVSDWNQYFRQRNVGFTLRYKFSKGEKPEERKRSTLEELIRTGN